MSQQGCLTRGLGSTQAGTCDGQNASVHDDSAGACRKGCVVWKPQLKNADDTDTDERLSLDTPVIPFLFFWWGFGLL